ncbi:MAG TPA: diaminopimelate decarboxylase family protein, partial [Candidatus Tripitaka sp. YC43]
PMIPRMTEDVLDARALIKQFGSPLYMYDASRLRQNVRKFKKIPYDNLEIYFASMCNNNPYILRLMRQMGVNIFVNSPKHLLIAWRCGFQAQEVIFTSSNLSDGDLDYAIKGKVLLNVDSLGQLERYGRLNPSSRVGLRINPVNLTLPDKADNVFVGQRCRLGILEAELDEAFRIAARYDLTLNGVHVYLGTNLMEVDFFRRGIEEVLRIAGRFRELEYVDLGGGFGVKSRGGEARFNMIEYGSMVSEKMYRFSETVGRDIRLILEPGRAMIADAGRFLTTVVDVKERANKLYIGTDASVDIFPRPLFYEDAFHEITVYGKDGQKPLNKLADICGNTTYSRDFIGRDRLLPQVSEGDVLIVHNAGGYCYSAITDFLGRLRPAEVLMDEGGAVLINERETLEPFDASHLVRGQGLGARG